MKTLVTGAKSGLGKYLSEQIKSDTLNRSDELPDIGEEYDLIIHCANNGNHHTWGDVEYDFYRDNIFLTRDISETIVSTIARDYLIIRPSSLLGKDMKENTFTKILHGEPVYLTEDSVMNYITHKDVLDVIEAEYPYDGIVYLCSNENITLGEIADLVGKKIEFGDYKCEQPSIFTDYNTNKTSKDNVTKFIEEMK